ISVLESLHSRRLDNRPAARRDTEAQWAQVWQGLDASLAAAGLADADWVPAWIAGLRRAGILTRAGADAASRALTRAITALVTVAGTGGPGTWKSVGDNRDRWQVPAWERGALASRATGGAHGLDDDQL